MIEEKGGGEQLAGFDKAGDIRETGIGMNHIPFRCLENSTLPRCSPVEEQNFAFYSRTLP